MFEGVEQSLATLSSGSIFVASGETSSTAHIPLRCLLNLAIFEWLSDRIPHCHPTTVSPTRNPLSISRRCDVDELKTVLFSFIGIPTSSAMRRYRVFPCFPLLTTCFLSTRHSCDHDTLIIDADRFRPRLVNVTGSGTVFTRFMGLCQ